MVIRRLKWQVNYCLGKYPKTRNSDIELRHQILRDFYPSRVRELKGREAVYLEDEFELPTQDAVKRVRAVFQNVEGKYLPTDWKVAKKRGIERAKWEDGLGYNLTSTEVATHKQTVKDTTPPPRLFEIPKTPERRQWL